MTAKKEQGQWTTGEVRLPRAGWHRRRWARRWPLVSCSALLLVLNGCAARDRLPAVPAVATPRYPEFVFPAAPAGTAPAISSQHARAWQFLQAGDTRTAEREFSAVLKRTPAFIPSLTGLGYVELAKKRPQPALGVFDKALQRSATYVPALVGRGHALLELGRADEALRAFEDALGRAGEAAHLDYIRQRVEVLRFQSLQASVAAARQAAAAGRYDQARQAYLNALAASPQSAFLHRELGVVERARGALDEALLRFGQALALDPGDARGAIEMAQTYELKGDFTSAIAWYEKAVALDSSVEIHRKLDAAREKAELAALPAEFHAIGSAPQVTRGALAALIGVAFKEALQTARPRAAVVATDTRTHWAAPWIAQVISAGVMEVYPNHTFQPGTIVRRAEMARTVSRLLGLLAEQKPRLLAEWRRARPAIPDLGPGNLQYPDVAMAVAAGIMPLAPDGAFRPARPVTGAEASDAIARLRALFR